MKSSSSLSHLSRHRQLEVGLRLSQLINIKQQPQHRCMHKAVYRIPHWLRYLIRPTVLACTPVRQFVGSHPCHQLPRIASILSHEGVPVLACRSLLQSSLKCTIQRSATNVESAGVDIRVRSERCPPLSMPIYPLDSHSGRV